MTEHEFLKKLNILYVEDDEKVREQISSTLTKVVKNLYIATDGQEAIDRFNELKKENIRIDAIISDINMPKVNGIEFLAKIREEDEELPFIFTTAYSEEEYLLDAIKLNATAYILKPVDFRELMAKINKVCHAYHQLDTIRKQKKELETYLSAIDNVAIVSKTDTKGKIIFANDIFCEIAQYTKEELYGQPHNMVRHPDMPKAAFEDLWKTVRSGNTWQGKVKNRAKDGSAYYVNATIIPIFDDFGEDIVEFVGIRFLTTDDELEKREFKKKVLQNIQDTKKKEMDSQKQIKLLEDQLKNYTNLDLTSINRQILDLRERNDKLYSQVVHYEAEMKDIKAKNSTLTTLANEKVKKASVIAIQLKKENEKHVILDFEKRLEEKNKYIEDLKDVINFKEKELENR